jgi:capping protein beta
MRTPEINLSKKLISLLVFMQFLIYKLEIEIDTVANREFLKCEYNRDGDAYRSCWSNKYFPSPTDDPIYPNADLLQLE